MPNRLHDPSLDVVRSGFLDNVSRFSLLLALANFICIFPLFFIYAYQAESADSGVTFFHYTTLLTTVGIVLTGLGLLCRYKNLASLVAKLCVALLLLEACYLLYQVNTIQHPVLMIFPILCFVATPILGLLSSYLVGGCIILALALLNFVVFDRGMELSHLPGFVLVALGIGFCSHISFLLWRGVLNREENLKTAMEKIQKRSDRYLAELLLKDRLDTIGLLASGLAHELNTPLTSLKFILSAKQSQIPKDTFQSVEEELNRMGCIVRDFLNYSSPHQDGEVIDLNQVVLMSVSLLSKFKHGAMRVVSELCLDELPVLAVKNQIEQIILNLYKNAFDSMGTTQKPFFMIRTQKLETGVVCVTLSDNGCGIDPEALPKIFDPFFTTKPMGKGTGLGLYIVQQIVHQHGGSIDVQSTKGVGSTVTIQMPLKENIQRKAA